MACKQYGFQVLIPRSHLFTGPTWPRWEPSWQASTQTTSCPPSGRKKSYSTFQRNFTLCGLEKRFQKNTLITSSHLRSTTGNTMWYDNGTKLLQRYLVTLILDIRVDWLYFLWKDQREQSKSHCEAYWQVRSHYSTVHCRAADFSVLLHSL